MGILSRIVATYGLDNNNKTLINVADPVNANDVATKNFSSNASNITTGTLPLSIFPNLSNDYISTSKLGVANGVATLNSSGLIPSQQLPSYVDDVLEFSTISSFPTTGETSKIYVSLDNNKIYRWSGSLYIEVTPNPYSTDSLIEGSTNLYFTTTRARNSISSGTGISYDTSTGIISVNSTISTVSDLNNEITRANNAESTLTANLNSEITRATNAEATLSANILVEKTRSLNAEATLTANLSSEITRASNSEATLTANLNNEITRATDAEATLQSNLNNEITRATNAEATLTSNILLEKTRSLNAEATLQSNLNNEITRAINAEATLTANLNSEITRALNAEALLIPLSEKGSANGVATLGSDSKVPSSQLPSYVDDVLEFNSLTQFPSIGTSSIIYVTLDTNRTYRWTGSTYVEISPSPGSTDSIVEGFNNLYFTNSRARSSLSSGTGISYDNITGIISTDSTISTVSGLNNEITRATNAEATLTANLNNEITRATNAEATLTSNLNNEITRALNAEALLIPLSEKGSANGVATLGPDSKIPSNQLPSYVDDIVEFNSISNLPSVGSSGLIYVTLDTNKIYRWSGSTYIEISSSVEGATIVGNNLLTIPSPNATRFIRINSDNSVSTIDSNTLKQSLGLSSFDSTVKLISSAGELLLEYDITGNNTVSSDDTLSYLQIGSGITPVEQYEVLTSTWSSYSYINTHSSITLVQGNSLDASKTANNLPISTTDGDTITVGSIASDGTFKYGFYQNGRNVGLSAADDNNNSIRFDSSITDQEWVSNAAIRANKFYGDGSSLTGIVTTSSQPANTIFAAPNGTSGTPTFRQLTSDDLPDIDGGTF